MSERTVAKRYAEAMFQLGKEHHALDAFKENFTVVQEVLQQDRKLIVFLENPRITLQKKAEVVDKAFAQIHSDILHLLQLLIQRHRIRIFSFIAEIFSELVRQAQGAATLNIYSVQALEDTRKQQLAETFKHKLGKHKIEIENEIDPSLIGGLKIRVGNTIYDGSVQGKLNRISRTIRTLNY